MKRLFVLMACAVVLGGCASKKPVKTVQAPVKAQAPVTVDINGVPIEYVPFRAGISTVTVENLAKAQGCVGGQGAGLMTPQGPVETYRMICDDRRVFMARCEVQADRSPNGRATLCRAAGHHQPGSEPGASSDASASAGGRHRGQSRAGCQSRGCSASTGSGRCAGAESGSGCCSHAGSCRASSCAAVGPPGA
jgi:hypothetical protein